MIEIIEDAQDYQISSKLGLKLFEVTQNAEGCYDRFHPSRGFATKLETSTEEIAPLREALKASKAGVNDDEKNGLFFDYINARNQPLASKFHRLG